MKTIALALAMLASTPAIANHGHSQVFAFGVPTCYAQAVVAPVAVQTQYVSQQIVAPVAVQGFAVQAVQPVAPVAFSVQAVPTCYTSSVAVLEVGCGHGGCFAPRAVFARGFHAVAVAPRILVQRAKVLIQGQPIRNLFRRVF